MKRRKLVIVVSLLLVTSMCTYCGSDEVSENTAKAPELQFNIDMAKLGAVYQQDDYGITLYPPKGWELVSAEVFQQLKEQISKNISVQEVSFEPIDMFFNEENQSILSIAHIIDVNKQGITDQDLLKKYQEFLTSEINSSLLKKGEFLKDGIHFVQVLIQDGDRVIFKLLVQNVKNQLIEFDYIVLKSTYNSEVKAIESSIGTISFINEER
jgi:hypothetical protein